MAMNIDAAVNISADVSGQQAVDKLSDSLKKVGDTGSLSAAQIQQSMRYLPKQFDDAFRSLAAGQAPMNVLLTQGSQLRDMFGGIVPAARAVGTMIGGMVTPYTLLAAAIGGVAFAAFKGRSQFDDLTNKLTLTGNAAGYSAAQVERMARTLSNTAGISAGAARDLASGLAASGQFVGKNLDVAEQAAARVQRMTGQTSDEVVKDFSNMSKGVAAWAAEHNRSYNYLTVAEFKHIKNLEDMGDKEGAMRANMSALNKAFADRTEQLGSIETAWKNITEWASKGWAAMLNIGKPESNEDKLDNLRKQLNSFAPSSTLPANATDEMRANRDARREAILEQMRLLQRGITAADTERTAKAKDAAKTRQEIEEIQSGKAAALQSATDQLALTKLQGASEQRIAVLEQEGQRVENAYRAGLTTEEQYNDDKLRIAKATLNERMKLAQQEIDLEGTAPVNSKADAVQKQVKLQALRNQLAQLGSQATLAELKADGDRTAYVRQMDEAVEKFSRTQQAHIDQINAEVDASRMSTLEYRQHTEALRIDREAADAAANKSPEWVAKIKAEAAAKKEATMAALAKADADKRAFGTGANEAMKDYIENVNNAATQARTLFTDAFKGMEDALVNFVKTGKLDFSALADSMISDMIRIQVQRSILGPLMGTGQNGDYGVMGSLAKSVGSLFGFANGGIMTASGSMPLNAYASGGIANSPQMAIFGEGKTPEAYVPLPDGRSIPVSLQGGGGGGSNVVVNVVNNAGGAKATSQERQDSNGNRIIDVFIEQVKASIAGDISRGVGTVTSALERTYGANRAAGAY